MPRGKRVRGVYSGPLFKKIDPKTGEIHIPKNILHKIGKELVKSVVFEARQDFARKQKSPRGMPIPDGGGIGPERRKGNIPGFFDSFSYHIRGERTIEVTSTLPWISSLLEGRPRSEMINLTAEKNSKLWRKSEYEQPRVRREGGKSVFTMGKDRVRRTLPLVTKDGTVIFRVVPLSTQDAWIHPGIAKHTFLERGIKRGKKNVAKILQQWLSDTSTT